MKRHMAVIFVAVFIMSAAAVPCQSANDDTSPAARLSVIENELNVFKPDPEYKEDPIALETVKQALASIKKGSFGIGACLVEENSGKILLAAHNEMTIPYFRSDKHAEMALLDKYEDGLKGSGPKTEGLVLYSSLEPCPMCTIRLLSANITKVRYVSPDIEGGFVRHMDLLPPFWKSQAAGTDYAELQCSPRLKKIAHELFMISLEMYGDRVIRGTDNKKGHRI